MKKHLNGIFALLLVTALSANAEKLTTEWTAKIEKLAPEKPAVAPARKRKALLFSVMTGFKHWVTPHTAAMMQAQPQPMVTPVTYASMVQVCARRKKGYSKHNQLFPFPPTNSSFKMLHVRAC